MFTLALFAQLLAGCGHDPAEHEVLRSVVSPDGRQEADVVQSFGGGAIVLVSEEVYVHPVGMMPAFDHRVFSSECARNIDLAWRGSASLEISYDIAAKAMKKVWDGAPWRRISSNDTIIVLRPRLHSGGCLD